MCNCARLGVRAAGAHKCFSFAVHFSALPSPTVAATAVRTQNRGMRAPLSLSSTPGTCLPSLCANSARFAFVLCVCYCLCSGRPGHQLTDVAERTFSSTTTWTRICWRCVMHPCATATLHPPICTLHAAPLFPHSSIPTTEESQQPHSRRVAGVRKHADAVEVPKHIAAHN